MSTHIDKMRGQYNYNRMQVLYLTGMSHEQLCNMQFDMGMQWLRKYALPTEITDAKDEEMLSWILSQPIIWKWWVNEWNRRDEPYLPVLYSLYEWDKRVVNGRYKALHYECFVGRTLRTLEDGYCSAIGKQNKAIS